MWKWVVGGGVALLISAAGLAGYLSDKIYLRPEHVVVAAADLDRRYAPEEMRADFRQLIATTAHIHPEIAAIVEQAAYQEKQAGILAALDRPMTRVEFARIATAINGQWRDGHTSLRRPQEEWDAVKAHGTVVPLLVKFDAQGATIDRGLGGLSIPAGARLVSINGVDSATLRDWIVDRTSGETIDYRRAYGAESFAAQAWLYGLAAPYRVEWLAPGASATSRATSSGASFAIWDGAIGALGAAPVALHVEGGVAHLVVSSLDSPLAGFKSALKSAFQTIRDQHVSVVVLDLRQNGGGDSRQGDLLQTYLSDDKLPALAEVSVRTTPEVKARYRTLLPEGFRWLPLNSLVPMLKGIQDGPDSGFYRFDPDAAQPKARLLKNPLAFTGKLYVLIGPVTYSSAAIFAAPLKYWKRATFVGQPTGEPMTFFGDNYEFDLSATHLVASVSHKAFKLLGSKGPASGIEPDIYTTPDHPDAYALALQEFAAARAAKAGGS